MNENIDLTKILDGCPEGTKFYSSVYGEVAFVEITNANHFPIKLKYYTIDKFALITLVTKDGQIEYDCNGECTLFPSKDQRDWSKFERFWDKPKVEKFDPKTFQPFDKVLIKRGTESYHLWFPDFISLPPNDVNETILCMNTDDVVMVIPYNEETKHLVDTNEEAPEFYRYWED